MIFLKFLFRPKLELLLQKLEKGLKLEPQNQDWLDSTLDNAKLKKLENLSPVAPLVFSIDTTDM